MKVTQENLIKAIGDLEDAVFGNTLSEMALYEQKNARNELKEKIMKKFGYQYRYTGVNEGHWEARPKKKAGSL